MKWNQFIVEQGETLKVHSPISHLHASSGSLSTNNHKNFKLKSLEKNLLSRSKNELNILVKKEESDSGDSDLQKMVSKISFKTINFSRIKDENSFEKYSSTNFDKQPLALGQLCETFAKDFQAFLDSFFTKHLQLRLKVTQRQILQKKILQGIQDSFSLFVRTKESMVFRSDSPVKKTILQSQKIGVLAEQSPVNQRKRSRALQFKNEKIKQKNNQNPNQQQCKQNDNSNYTKIMNKKLDQNANKKFSRAGSRTKRDRSADSSVEDIIQRSFNDSLRSSRSKLKARQALYKFNQVLHQNNLS